jgi:RNA polymerase sigma-70 factor (ECF subfamily)
MTAPGLPRAVLTRQQYEPACQTSVNEKQYLAEFLLQRTEEAFCALFEAVYARVRRYFVLRGLDVMTAEDLAQNVLVIVYRRASEVREPELFLGWLFAVARNELLRHVRQARRHVETVEYEPLSAGLAEQLYGEPAEWHTSQLQEWLSYLEPAERDLLVLRFVEELSYEELALALALPLGTVKWRLYNAKQKLARIIQETTPERLKPKIH